ncbi:transcriptional repressor [Dissulfurirhabdus thermomarina]|uniref:Transcriptional repressor n=1 Tax=Dissulfurirhabdus thermomarina TaxID=1765737 RepID=A0A6N9TQS8_DISTH|nr:transcriptional repressor [Dissulfurirhabdus thermomarina]NDY42463.1 transcriptional repressor [Dissulfurirhabdus thermomarina]NMX23851.1 transcriptional repressor [Dissulfurirhabdus thermomarina]
MDELEIFRDFIRRKGLRYTPERERIIREIFATHDHFDVETLYLGMRRKGHRVSKASIYRLLPLLIEAGLVQEVFFEDGHMHYEHIYGHDHHCHLRCTQCRRIEEFTDPALEDVERRLAERFGYRVQGHKLEVLGLCPACRERQRRRSGTGTPAP